MAQRKPTKARIFQYGTICLNKVLNPNLRFNSLFSQKLFEEHKVIVDKFWSLKPHNFPNQKFRICLWKNGVNFSSTFTKPSKPTDCFRNPKISKPQNPRKSRETDKGFENQYTVNQSN